MNPTYRSLTLLLLAAAAALAQAQTNTNIRGTVAAFDGKTISVATREGKAVDVQLPETVNVAGTQAFTLADLKPGTVLGVTTVRRADGALIAIDVRPIPPTARLGLSPFDLQPESTMTNASLEVQVVSTDGAELTLNLGSGTPLKVLVPPGTPMSRSVPGQRADIKPGETVFIAARPDEQGRLVAVRVQVSTNGVKPTQ
jgi:hypothetical protein